MNKEKHESYTPCAYFVPIVLVLAWTINYLVLVHSDGFGQELSCSDKEDLARLNYVQVVKEVRYGSASSENHLLGRIPRILKWKHHVIIAFIEEIAVPNKKSSTGKQRVVRLLQNVTEVRKPLTREMFNTDSSGMSGVATNSEGGGGSRVSRQWKTMRTLRSDKRDEHIEGPIQLTETPDGNGVVVLAQSTQGHKMISVSTDPQLSAWHTTFVAPKSTNTTTVLDLARVSKLENKIIKISAIRPHGAQTYHKTAVTLAVHVHTSLETLNNQTTVENAAFFTTLPSGQDAHQATVTSTEIQGYVNIFVVGTKGTITKLEIDLHKSNSTEMLLHTETKRYPVRLLRVIPFNLKAFSVTRPNFSLFLASGRHTTFDTLYTTTFTSEKMMVIKLDFNGQITSCSPLKRHVGQIGGLSSTQLTDDTILVAYTRRFEGVDSIHVANVYVGNAHVSH